MQGLVRKSEYLCLSPLIMQEIVCFAMTLLLSRRLIWTSLQDLIASPYLVPGDCSVCFQSSFLPSSVFRGGTNLDRSVRSKWLITFFTFIFEISAAQQNHQIERSKQIERGKKEPAISLPPDQMTDVLLLPAVTKSLSLANGWHALTFSLVYCSEKLHSVFVTTWSFWCSDWQCGSCDLDVTWRLGCLSNAPASPWYNSIILLYYIYNHEGRDYRHWTTLPDPQVWHLQIVLSIV